MAPDPRTEAISKSKSLFFETISLAGSLLAIIAGALLLARVTGHHPVATFFGITLIVLGCCSAILETRCIRAILQQR